MNECVLPATGAGTASLAVGFVLVVAGAVVLSLTRRARPTLPVVLLAAGGLVVADRAQATSPDCAATPSAQVSSTSSPAPSTPIDSSTPVGFTPPASPPGTSVGASLSVSDTSPNVGDSITATGRGFPASAEVTLVLYSDPVVVGGTVSDGDGGFSTSLTIPSGTTLGTHVLAVFAGGTTAAVDLLVVGGDRPKASAPVSPSTPVPTTTTSPGATSTTTAVPTTPPSTNTTTTSTASVPATTTTTSVIERAPVATLKDEVVSPGGSSAGSLLEGDDLGAPPALLRSAEDEASAGEVPLPIDGTAAVLHGWRVDDDEVVECGTITIDGDGDYLFVPPSVIEAPMFCEVGYTIGNEVGEDSGTVRFRVGGELPVATDKTVEVFAGEQVGGSLLEGDELGVDDPATLGATLAELIGGSVTAQFGVGEPFVLHGTDSTGDVVECGKLTVDRDGTYDFLATSGITSLVTCQVRYWIVNTWFGDSATLTLVVTPTRAPDATYKLKDGMTPGATFTGSLLEGDDLGAPAATLQSLENSAGVVFEVQGDQEDAELDFSGITGSGEQVECGMFTFSADGAYTAVFSAAAEPMWCWVVYRIENVAGADEGVVEFLVGAEVPVATSKSVSVFGDEQVSGSLTEGDDLGGPDAAFVVSVQRMTGPNSFDDIAVGETVEIGGTDSSGATVPCGHISRVTADEYTFRGASVADEVSCRIDYLLRNTAASSVGTVTFLVTPSRAPDATAKVHDVLAGATHKGSLLSGDDLGLPAAVLATVSDLEHSIVEVNGNEGTYELTVQGRTREAATVTVPCGTLTFDETGDYSFVADETEEQLSCRVGYAIQSPVGDDSAVVEFVVTPPAKSLIAVTPATAQASTLAPASPTTTSTTSTVASTTPTSVEPPLSVAVESTAVATTGAGPTSLGADTPSDEATPSTLADEAPTSVVVQTSEG